MSSPIRAIIDTGALRNNLRKLREHAPRTRMVAVIKANAYGHGLITVARALVEADAFGVARIEEGMALRAAGISQPILLLEGVFDREELAEAAHQNFELVVHSPMQIELLESSRSEHRFVLWLKIDTGMNRLGFRTEDFPGALTRIEALRVPSREIRLMTHLARADEREVETTREQIDRFESLTHGLGLQKSLCNSAGLLGLESGWAEWARPGIALYGVSPFPHESAASFGLTPAMTLESTVIAIKRVRRGECVGYGGAWRAATDCTIAILAGGYGDGLLRCLDSGAPVLVADQRAPLVGRVSMDMVAVNVSAIPDARVGSRCVFWGAGLDVEEVATHAGTIPYELLCAVTPRVPYEIV